MATLCTAGESRKSMIWWAGPLLTLPALIPLARSCPDAFLEGKLATGTLRKISPPNSRLDPLIYLDSAGLVFSGANSLLVRKSVPTKAQFVFGTIGLSRYPASSIDAFSIQSEGRSCASGDGKGSERR
jgi:hypothetical protein